MKNFSTKNSRGGFTMIELVVAMAVFSIIVTVILGGIVRSLQDQRRLSSLIAADNDVSIALEQMAREIRTGFRFCRDAQACAADIAGGDCTLATPTISNGNALELDFLNADSQTV